jgi:predicted ATPase (AAA+ superfamily)
MQYIHRQIEDVVCKAAQSFKAVLITGARQTGKSTLLRELFPERKQLSFDDLFLEEQAKENPEMFMMLHEPPIVLNEVQRVPDLFRYLKLQCDNSEAKGQFLLSGSQPFSLMRLASESLAGRVAVLELSTLSLRELTGDSFSAPFVPGLDYLRERQKTVVKPKNIWEYIHRGGYPGVQDATVDWQMYFSSYVKTYLERDVRELSAVQDLDAFRKFMIACAARTGEILNYSNIAGEIGKDADTVKRWLSILEASGIIYLLEPYTASVLKRAIKTPKLYFRDTGLAAYLTRWLTVETLANGAMSGAFFETFVISEILKSYANRGLDYRYFVSYYRGRDLKSTTESEIDFIIEENGILYPVEIKQNSKPKADMTAAFQLLDTIPEKKRGMGAVVCLCPEPGVLRDNVLALPVWYI